MNTEEVPMLPHPLDGRHVRSKKPERHSIDEGIVLGHRSTGGSNAVWLSLVESADGPHGRQEMAILSALDVQMPDGTWKDAERELLDLRARRPAFDEKAIELVLYEKRVSEIATQLYVQAIAPVLVEDGVRYNAIAEGAYAAAEKFVAFEAEREKKRKQRAQEATRAKQRRDDP